MKNNPVIWKFLWFLFFALLFIAHPRHSWFLFMPGFLLIFTAMVISYFRLSTGLDQKRSQEKYNDHSRPWTLVFAIVGFPLLYLTWLFYMEINFVALWFPREVVANVLRISCQSSSRCHLNNSWIVTLQNGIFFHVGDIDDNPGPYLGYYYSWNPLREDNGYDSIRDFSVGRPQKIFGPWFKTWGNTEHPGG